MCSSQTCCKIAKERLEADPTLSERTPLPIPVIIDLLETCLSSTYFQFENVIYKQKQGMAMGAAISVTMANLAMEDVEERAFAAAVVTPKFFRRYVDDCFAILPKKEVQTFLDHLNRQEPSIQFTLETEQDGVLPFLDLSIKRNPADGSLDFGVYRNQRIPAGIFTTNRAIQ